MECRDWTIRNTCFDRKSKGSKDALFSVGNGYFGIRGFFEEDTQGVDASGGIYMAGIFGRGVTEAWEGESRELCVVTNMLRARLFADAETVCVNEEPEAFVQELDMQKGVYRRSYVYTTESRKKVRISFSRFADRREIHHIVQRICVEALDGKVAMNVSVLLDSDVANLNLSSTEPLPVQPGRSHVAERVTGRNRLMTVLDDEDATKLWFAQFTRGYREADGERQELAGEDVITDKQSGTVYQTCLEKGERLLIEKTAAAYSSKDEADGEAEVERFLGGSFLYEEQEKAHTVGWDEKWKQADIEIETDTEDQAAVRYNIFQLLCVCPEHTDRLSIGARGLSGEMYEGCVFWDNEIFKLPLFLYTAPEAAKKLLMFRYHTLDAARRHAAKNWFEGAMYPWQASEKGIEQTPYNVGAYYAIHISSDIAYAIKQYWDVTGDHEFMLRYGAEIMIETARFFASRCDWEEQEGVYVIRAVRGPNEYDVYVNNNLYTNMMVTQNFRTVRKVVEALKGIRPQECESMCRRMQLGQEELKRFRHMEKHMKIPYNGEWKLYEEDDAYCRRRPLDMKKAKPGGKRIIDSTLPYEALPLYQVTKQADVLLLMNLLPHLFTEEEKKQAYRFYEPRTAHDSSLSYAPHAVLAAQTGLPEESYAYFEKSAYLDIDDRQLNTISGLHFANFGGTWQAVYFGYGGVSQADGVLYINPRMPKQWSRMRFTICFRGNLLSVEVLRKNGKESVKVKRERGLEVLTVNVCGKEQKV